MVFISKDGEVIRTGEDHGKVVALYDAWQAGLDAIEIHTSGSTGTPKAIKLDRSALLASIHLTASYFDLGPADLFLCNLNTEYIGGKMMVLRAAELRAELLAVDPRRNPFEELDRHRYLLLRNRGNNFFSFVPLQLQDVLVNPEHLALLKTAKAILVGGAAVSPALRATVQEHALPVYETYGMTETVSHIALKDLRTDDAHFTVLEGVQIDTDEDHCLRISSPSTGLEWIQTQDVVELLSPTQFRLLGRRGNIINSGGVKIQLEDVERRIAEAMPQLENFFCYGLPDDDLGQKLVLVLEGAPFEINWDDLTFPKYHKPKDILFFPHFARTASGKIDKIKTIQHD